MSNKCQLKMSPNKRMPFILCCDLSKNSILVINLVSILLLLLTSTTLIVESAKLETQTKSTIIKIATNDNSYNNNYNNDEDVDALITTQHRSKYNNNLNDRTENFYHSELKRLSYDTIHSILRDEKDPIFRGDDMDLRYYHTKSLQPTHEVMKRDISMATINRLKLKAKNLTEFNSEHMLDPIDVKTITDIDLSLNKLKSVNLTIYENLLTLNLSNNQLEELPITINSTIVLLDLNSNHIQTAQSPINNHLKALYLSGNEIENLAALNLSLLTALETLDLSCNRIKNLETSFFPQLMHNLKFLNLAHNNLGSISRETFYNLLSLNTLLLANNNISYIDYETFLSLPNLQYLDLSNNQLKGESIRALQGIPDLVGLSIAYNSDMGESLQEFVASWSLKEVDASGTGLCQIPAALAQAVRTLKLADNWLKIINCGDLDSYPLLQHLDLSNSHIEDIEDDAMGRLEFLEVLFLDHNQLRKVPISLPTSLEHLFLQFNEIMDLQMQAFQGLKNLKTLDLSHNKLLYLPALPLPKLLTLNLQSSGLQGLNQAIVHTLPHLRDLLLEENPIKCSDLLGIAEWASPCRIAERGAITAAKNIDSEQIADADLGQRQQTQMQTVAAKIDLKQKFVQTHNFYEKFKASVGGCSNCIVEAIVTPTIPPTCAIELEDEDEVIAEVEKPTVQAEPGKIAQKLVEQQQQTKPNVNFDESHKVVEPEMFNAVNVTTHASSLVTTAAATPTLGITLNANHTSTTVGILTKSSHIVIANVTSSKLSPTATAAVTPAIFSSINFPQKVQNSSQQTAEPTTTTTNIVPTTLISATSTMSLKKSIAIAKNFIMLMPETMPTSSTKRELATTNNYVDLNSTQAASLLERQRRLKGYEEMTTATNSQNLLLSTSTAATTQKTHQAQNLTHDSQKMLPQRKSSNNFTNSNGGTKNDFNGEFSEILPKTSATTTTTTTIAPQHKHVTLQLNVKDRHLIGTPLLTHHGENLMVAAEELKKNGNHIAAKTTTTQAQTLIKPTTTASSTMQKQLDESQKQQAEKEANKFTKSHDAENLATETATEKLTEAVPAATTQTSMKFGKKLHNEQKKKPSLIMKKMTVTTKHATTTNSPKVIDLETQQLEHHHQQQQQHHYTLNIPRENEALFNSQTSHAIPLEVEKPLQHLALKHHQHNSALKHHSTVNTPIIHGHEIEPQTFQEHNEIEEAAAVAARASTSAKFNSKLHEYDGKWSTAQNMRLHFDNPIIVILAGFALFLTLVLSLLHAYRCKMPNILSFQRQQLHRPSRQQEQQQQQQGQQMRLRNSNQTHENDNNHSFLSGGSNQFQRQWRLERAHNQQEHQQTKSQLTQPTQLQISPLHNLQVRELQQTSSVERCPKYCKTSSYNVSSALGERSNSHTSSSCSPHSSCTFDDETCYIEMTTDVGQPIASSSCSISHSDLLPMELLNVKGHEFIEDDELQISDLNTYQTSAIDEASIEDILNQQLNTKLTPRTRKLGIW